MNKDRFVSAIRDFCGHCGLNDPMAIVNGSAVEVDGVAFSLFYSEKTDPRLLLICCDVASLPVGKKLAKTLSDLLLKNFYQSAYRGPVFGIAPNTGHILMTQTEALDGLTGAHLLERLQELGRCARSWRELPEIDRGPGRAPSGGVSKPAASSRTLLRLQDRR